MKSLLISASLLATLLLTGCDSLQESLYRDAIKKAMHESSLTGSEPSDEHVQALQSIDISNCPKEFRAAWIQYIHAWEEEVAVGKATEQVDSQEDGAAAGGIIATVFGLSSTPWSDHLEAEKRVIAFRQRADDDLKTTASSLNDVARSFGLN